MILEPLEAVGWACGTGIGERVVSEGFVGWEVGIIRGELPVVVGVEMKGAKVDVLQVENGGEIFARGAVIVEIPVVGAGAVVEVAVSAKGDEMVGVERFDVLAYFIGPIGQDLAAVAFGFLASGLRIGQAVGGRIQGGFYTSLASSHAKIAGESLYLVTISLT